jgi:DNA-binding MarR family transcriptional regulator
VSEETKAEVFSDLVIEVFRANSTLLAEGDELTRPVGLTSARWQVLGVVEHGPAPVAQVARAMGLTRQSVQQTADALVGEGMLAFADNPHHRRARLLTLTPRAEQAMERLRADQARWAGERAERFTAAELATALGVLRRLADPDPEAAP